MDAILSERIGRDDVHVDGQVKIAFEDAHLLGDGVDGIAMLAQMVLIVNQKPIVNVRKSEVRAESQEPHVGVAMAYFCVLADWSLFYLLLHPK